MTHHNTTISGNTANAEGGPHVHIFGATDLVVASEDARDSYFSDLGGNESDPHAGQIEISSESWGESRG